MTHRPFSVTIVFVFVVLNALVWLAFAILIVSNAHPALPVQPVVKGSMAFLSFAAAAILVGLFIFLAKRSRIAYFLALSLFAVTSLLTIFDDFGLADLVVVVINIFPLVLLIKDRAWYLQSMPQTPVEIVH
jgi:lysylphosphatidylglycerol synthetase-like protein (DUF2156 family)